MRYFYDNKAVCLNHTGFFFTKQFWCTQERIIFYKEVLMLCLLSLISQTGGKIVAYVKNEERNSIAADKRSPSMNLNVTSGFTRMWIWLQDALDIYSLETIPEMHIYLETNRIKMQSDSFKVRSLKFENYPLSCQKEKKHFAVAIRVCNCYFIWF